MKEGVDDVPGKREREKREREREKRERERERERESSLTLLHYITTNPLIHSSVCSTIST